VANRSHGEKTEKECIKEFFVRGREITLPDGDQGFFLRYSKSGKAHAVVQAGTIQHPRGNLKMVSMKSLEDKNISKYWSC